MGEIDCLKGCWSCQRHVRCNERTCPFCGVALAFFMRAPEYRLKTRLGRGATFGLGAALSALGFALGCSGDNAMALYGGTCAPPCGISYGGEENAGGGTAGASAAGAGGRAGSGGATMTSDSAAGEGGEPEGGAGSAPPQ